MILNLCPLVTINGATVDIAANVLYPHKVHNKAV